MLVMSQLLIQTTNIFYSFLTCTCAPPLWKRFCHPCVWLVACFDVVKLFIFLILWTLQLQFILQLSAWTLQCLRACTCHNTFTLPGL